MVFIMIIIKWAVQTKEVQKKGSCAVAKETDAIKSTVYITIWWARIYVVSEFKNFRHKAFKKLISTFHTYINATQSCKSHSGKSGKNLSLIQPGCDQTFFRREEFHILLQAESSSLDPMNKIMSSDTCLSLWENLLMQFQRKGRPLVFSLPI